MTDATIALDVLETLYVSGNNTLEVSLDVIVAVDLVTDLFEFGFSQVFDSLCAIDSRSITDILCVLRADTIDISQTDLYLFFGWDGYVSNSRHKLSLPLLIFRLFLVDDIEAAFAAHQLIIGADFLDTGSNLHE